ncbi:MAG: hypothetical protein DRI77_07740, partial [Chloroflexi bacterium]
MKSPSDWHLCYAASAHRFANHYLCYAQTHAHDFASLDQESANFQTARVWLAVQDDSESAQQIIAFTRALAVYLRQRALNNELLAYCHGGLQACERLGVNQGWVLLLQYEAHNALGDWDNALTDAQAAIKASRSADPINHARAVLALGRLQLNRGDYRLALNTLATAEKLLYDLQDLDGITTAKAEVAAYHLNRGELDQALYLYLEVDQLRRRAGATSSADHTLLMLGVVYRKKGDYQKATGFLHELLRRGELEENPGTVATAAHHLAWVNMNQGNLGEARRLGERAKQLYLEISDPRGASDADEQLGLIALSEGNTDVALFHLKR